MLDGIIKGEAGRMSKVKEPVDREAYLLNDLLTRESWVTIDKLSERLRVSRAAVSKDLCAVEERSVRYGLTLERVPRYGLRISGDELVRRN